MNGPIAKFHGIQARADALSTGKTGLRQVELAERLGEHAVRGLDLSETAFRHRAPPVRSQSTAATFPLWPSAWR
jgi:hypothetical protein